AAGFRESASDRHAQGLAVAVEEHDRADARAHRAHGALENVREQVFDPPDAGPLRGIVAAGVSSRLGSRLPGHPRIRAAPALPRAAVGGLGGSVFLGGRRTGAAPHRPAARASLTGPFAGYPPRAGAGHGRSLPNGNAAETVRREIAE